MDSAKYLRMFNNIPNARVPISKSRWIGTFSVNAYLGAMTVAAFGYLMYGSVQNFNPYQLRPLKKIYKADPDYITSTVEVSSKEVKNLLKDY
mmetsp:Transcript_100371/g.139496  ORF Transcript_100371/g.139496 Transcript_100371/m.139496 type:complete len:92 (+) Transcript_100371:67-342(+)